MSDNKPRKIRTKYHFWNCYKCGRFVKILWEHSEPNAEVGYTFAIQYECSKCGEGWDGA